MRVKKPPPLGAMGKDDGIVDSVSHRTFTDRETHAGVMLAHNERVAALISQVVTLVRPGTEWSQMYLLDHAGETAREPFIWLTLLMHFFRVR